MLRDKKMPRIALFTGHISKKVGGFEEYFIQLNAERQGDLLVIENDYHAIPDGVKRRLEEAGLQLHRGRIHRNPFKAAADIHRILRMHKPSIVHVHFAPVSYITIILARLMGIRNIFWTKHSMLCVRKYSKTWWYHKICTQFVKKIICVSHAIEKELGSLGLGNAKRLALPLGINLEKFDPDKVSEGEREKISKELGLSESDFVISIVAQIQPVKRLDVFIKAMNILVNDYRMNHIKAFIIGGTFAEKESERLEAEYRQLIYDCNLSGNLTLFGVREDIPHIYSISNLSGLTSLTEGLPLSLAEAAAMGLPLFGSNTSGINEIVKGGHNGVLFEVENYRELAAKIRELVENEALAREYGESSKKIVSEIHDVRANVKVLNEYYETVS